MKIVTALVACIALTWSSPLLPRQSLITPLDLIGGQRTLVAIVEDLIFNVTEIPKPGGAAKAAVSLAMERGSAAKRSRLTRCRQ